MATLYDTGVIGGTTTSPRSTLAANSSELLAPVYNWFTEGFDTNDLIDAKALLDKLAR